MNTTLSYPVKHSVNVPIERFYMYGVDNIKPNTNDTECIVRDKNIPNRYWLKFPPAWRTSEQKERIIGIRSLWTNETYRRLITFNIKYNSDENDRKYECELNFYDHFIDKLNETMRITDDRMHFTGEVSNDHNQFILHLSIKSDNDNLKFQLTDMSDDAVSVFNSFIKDEEGVLRPVKETEMRLYNHH